jgi:hypothetical protein
MCIPPGKILGTPLSTGIAFFLTYQRQLFFQSLPEIVERLLSWAASVLRIRIRDNTFFSPLLLLLLDPGSVIRDLDPDPGSGFGLLGLERMQHFCKSKIELSVIFVSFSAILTV